MYLTSWLEDVCYARNSKAVTGLEKLFCIFLVLLRIFSITYWVLNGLEHVGRGENITEEARAKNRNKRNQFIEVFVVGQLIVLAVLLWLSPDCILPIASAVAAYLLYIMFLGLFNFVFVSKISETDQHIRSRERSLILIGINVMQMILCFSLFYREFLHLDPKRSIVYAILVFGTVGHPVGSNSEGGYIVGLQILLDFLMVILFITPFLSSLAVITRNSGSGLK